MQIEKIMEYETILTAGILTLIFILLSMLHWYWVFGGKGGLDSALPVNDGKRVFSPGPISTAIVALSLMFAAAVCSAHGELFGLSSSVFTRIGVGGLGLAFTLRAVGDFRLVGFFKRVKGTSFSRMDTLFFTPLCLSVSVMCWILL